VVLIIAMSLALFFHGYLDFQMSMLPLSFALAVLVGSVPLIYKIKYEIVAYLNGFVSVVVISYGIYFECGVFTEFILVPIGFSTIIGHRNVKRGYAFFALFVIYFFVFISFGENFQHSVHFEEGLIQKMYVVNLVIFSMATYMVIFDFINTELHFRKWIKAQADEILALQKEQHENDKGLLKKDMELLDTQNLLKQEFQAKMLDTLKALKGEKDSLVKLEIVIRDLQQEIKSESKQQLLNANISTVNSVFYEKLLELVPDLSKSEREICALVRLNLSNKEIAELRYTSVNAVNVSTGRIRKKMGLNRQQELYNFIQKIK
jgi:DNA-binding CsgD family transcriptional regulator